MGTRKFCRSTIGQPLPAPLATWRVSRKPTRLYRQLNFNPAHPINLSPHKAGHLREIKTSRQKPCLRPLDISCPVGQRDSQTIYLVRLTTTAYLEAAGMKTKFRSHDGKSWMVLFGLGENFAPRHGLYHLLFNPTAGLTRMARLSYAQKDLPNLLCSKAPYNVVLVRPTTRTIGISSGAKSSIALSPIEGAC